MEHINRRIYLVVLTLRISSFGHKLIQEPLQKRTNLALDSETQEDLEKDNSVTRLLSPVYSAPEKFTNEGFKAMLHEAIFLATCNATNVALQVARKNPR